MLICILLRFYTKLTGLKSSATFGRGDGGGWVVLCWIGCVYIRQAYLAGESNAWVILSSTGLQN